MMRILAHGDDDNDDGDDDDDDDDDDDSAEFFIPNSDIAMDSHVFNDENSQPLNNYEVAMG